MIRAAGVAVSRSAQLVVRTSTRVPAGQVVPTGIVTNRVAFFESLRLSQPTSTAIANSRAAGSTFRPAYMEVSTTYGYRIGGLPSAGVGTRTTNTVRLQSIDDSVRTIQPKTKNIPNPYRPSETITITNGGLPPARNNGNLPGYQGKKTNKVDQRVPNAQYITQWGSFVRESNQLMAAFEGINFISGGFVVDALIYAIMDIVMNYIDLERSKCDPELVGPGTTCEGYNEESETDFPKRDCVDGCGYYCKYGEGQCGICEVKGMRLDCSNAKKWTCRACFHHWEYCYDPLPYRQHSGSGCFKDSLGDWQCSHMCPQVCATLHPILYPGVGVVEALMMPVPLPNGLVMCCIDCKATFRKKNLYNQGCSLEEPLVNQTDDVLNEHEYPMYFLGTENIGLCIECNDFCSKYGYVGFREIEKCSDIADAVCVPCTNTIPFYAQYTGNAVGGVVDCPFECYRGYFYDWNYRNCFKICGNNQFLAPLISWELMGSKNQVCCTACPFDTYLVSVCTDFAPTWCCRPCPPDTVKKQECDRYALSEGGNTAGVCEPCPTRINQYSSVVDNACVYQCNPNVISMQNTFVHNNVTLINAQVCCSACPTGKRLAIKCNFTHDSICENCIPSDASQSGAASCSYLCNAGFVRLGTMTNELDNACIPCSISKPRYSVFVMGGTDEGRRRLFFFTPVKPACSWQCLPGFYRYFDNCIRTCPQNTVYYPQTSLFLVGNSEQVCCTPCQSGTYQVQPCTETLPTLCCSMCPIGFYKGQECTYASLNSAGYCLKCPFKINHEYLTFSVDCFGTCKPSSKRMQNTFTYKGVTKTYEVCCSECPSGQRIKTACTYDQDTVCESCIPSNGYHVGPGICDFQCNNGFFRLNGNCATLMMTGDFYQNANGEWVPCSQCDMTTQVVVDTCGITTDTVCLGCNSTSIIVYKTFVPVCEACPVGKIKINKELCEVYCQPPYLAFMGSCRTCQAGYYFRYYFGVPACEPCPSGTYQPSIGQFGCIPCNTTCKPFESVLSTCGYHKNLECAPCYVSTCPQNATLIGNCSEYYCVCNPGFYLNNSVCVSCTNCSNPFGACTASSDTVCSCSSGSYYNTSINLCQPCSACPAGLYPVQACDGTQKSDVVCKCILGYEYYDDVGCVPCATCSLAYDTNFTQRHVYSHCFAEIYGELQCFCEPHLQSGADVVYYERNECRACPPGFERSTENYVCYPCAHGKFRLYDNQSACLTCNKGSMIILDNLNRPISCEACPAGKHSITSVTSCDSCARGTYKTQQGTEECKICTAHSYPLQTYLSCTNASTSPYCFEDGGLTSANFTCSMGVLYNYNYNAGENKVWEIEVKDASKITISFQEGTSGLLFQSNMNLDFLFIYPCRSMLCTPITLSGVYSVINNATDSEFSLQYYTFHTNALTLVWTANSSNIGWQMRWAADVEPLELVNPGKYVSNLKILSCPRGFFSNTSFATFCHQCTPGFFQDMESSTACKSCAESRIKSVFGAVTCNFCYPGTFINVSKQSISLNDSILCDICPQGSYQDLVDATHCKTCEAGKYQKQYESTVCLDCLPGTIPFQALYCIPCTAGSYQPFQRGFQCIPCPAEQYQPEEEATSCKNCTKCFQDSIVSDCTLTKNRVCVCPYGYEGDGVTCTECQSGTEPLNSTFNNFRFCAACVEGKYSDRNDSVLRCKDCSPGKFQPIYLQSFCYDCPVGTYQNNSGSTICTNCSTCPDNFRMFGCSGANQGACFPESALLCPYAYYFNGLGCALCPPGTFKNFYGFALACDQCLPGFYTNTFGFETCRQCSIGSYSSYYGATVCTFCELGKFVESYGSSSADACQACGPSLYGVEYLLQTFCEYCSFGKYQTGYGMTSESSCKSCSIGTYSSSRAQSITDCLSCQPGTFSSANGASVCTSCLVGQYNDKANQSACQACPAGKESQFPYVFCSACSLFEYPCYGNISKWTTSYCPNGVINHKTNGVAETVMWYMIPFTNSSLGTVTFKITNTPSTAFDSGAIALYGYSPKRCGYTNPVCFLGNYNFYGTSLFSSVLDQLGSFNLTFVLQTYRGYDVQFTFEYSTGLKSCAPCPVGLMSLKEDGPFCDTCAYGYYSSQSKCLPCPAGTYCPFNSTPVTCNNLRWGNVLAQSTFESGCNNLCIACPGGTVKVNCSGSSAGVCAPCPANYYGGGFVCTPCPNRSVSTAGSDDIEDCQCTGFEQIYSSVCTPCLSNMVKTNQKCACNSNFYGVFPEICKQCPIYRDSPVNTTILSGCICRPNFVLPQCVLCTSGYYLNASYCAICRAGFFCPDGINSYSCPSGTWGTVTAQTTSALACPNQCGTCPLGQYKSNCFENKEGLCQPCPANTYGGGPGVISPCTQCPAVSTSPQGSINFDACECQGDYQMHQSVCQPCMQNMVKLGRYCVCAEDYYGYFPLGCSPCQPNSDSLVNSTKGSDCVCRSNFQPPYCSICVLGYYLADSQCNICQEDHYCSDGLNMTSCQNNSDSPQGSYASEDCICRPNFQPPSCQTCKLGYYLSDSQCVLCQEDYYCPDGLGILPCPSNSDSSRGTNASLFCICRANFEPPLCDKCNAGYYLVSLQCTPCSPGTYCPDGLGNVSCPAATWNNASAQSVCPYPCIYCPLGQWLDSCGGSSKGTCRQCPANTYGGGYNVTTPCKACPSGTTSALGSGLLENCLCLGSKMLYNGDCVACLSNMRLVGSQCVCNAGYYGSYPGGCLGCGTLRTSSVGTTSITGCVCNVGYYGNYLGCTRCPGRRTSVLNTTSVENCFCVTGYKEPNCTTCVIGYYLLGGVRCDECLPGRYCPDGTNMIECNGGRIGYVYGASTYEEGCYEICALCPRGNYRSGCYLFFEGECLPCPANTYSDIGNLTSVCSKCPVNSSSPELSSQIENCTCYENKIIFDNRCLNVWEIPNTTTSMLLTTSTSTSLAPTTSTSTSLAPTTSTTTSLAPTTSTTTSLAQTTSTTTSLAPTTSTTTSLAPTTSTTTSLAPTTSTSTSLALTTSTTTSLAPTTSTSTSLAPTTSTSTSLAPTTSTSTSLAPTTSTTTSLATTTLVTTSLTTSTTSLITSTTSLSTTTTLTTTTTPMITTTTRAPLCTPRSYENGVECVTCPEGYFCPDGRDIFECGGGMWGNTSNQSSYYASCTNPCGGCPVSEWRSFCSANFEGICAPCPANTYGGGPAFFTPCTPCPVNGTSLPGSSSIEQCQCPSHMWLVSGNCSFCPANMTLVDGVCVCNPNYHGSFLMGCLPCPANSDSPMNSLTILQCVCRANFYRDSNLCPACPSNSTSLPASLSITACKCVANFYSNSNQCLKCPAFSLGPAGSSSISWCTCIPGYNREEPYLCSPCPAGYVCPSQNVVNLCPDNLWGNLTGQHEISKACPFPCGTCPLGQYKIRCGAFNPGVCRECEAGQYGGGQGAVSSAWCQTCPTGSTSQRGSGSATDCACKQNFYGSPGLFCWPCPSNSLGLFGATDVFGCVCNANFYGPDQFAQCAACPLHSTSQKGSRLSQNCTCVPGFYGPNGGICEPCPPLWTCPGGNSSLPPYFSRTLIGISACCDVISTFPGSPAVNFYPVSFKLTSVSLTYDDGFVYSLPISSPNLTFRYDAAYLSLNSSTFFVLNIRTYPSTLLATNVTVVVNGAFTSTITVTIPDVTELMLQTYFPEGLDPSKRELRRFQCSDQYQWLEVTCKARVNLPAILPISSKCNLFVRNPTVAKVFGDTIVGVSPGTTSAYAVWWGRQAEIPPFDVLDESVEFSELSGTDYLFYGVSGERKPIFLGIVQTLANGVNTQSIPNVFNSEFAKLIQVSLPASGSVIRQGNFLISQLNSMHLETVFFSLPPCNGKQLTYNSTLLVNLLPAPGDLDAGHVQGVAITPDMLTVSLRFNLDGVLGFHSEFGCDFQITDCVPSPLFSGESACTVFDPTGAVRVAGINRGQSGIVEVAILFVEGTPGGLQGWIQTTKGFTSIIAGKWGPGSMNPDPFFPAFPLLDINSVYRANGENLLVLVNQQRLLVNSVVFASDRELSVLVRLVNRMDIPSTDRVRAYYHVNSTVEIPYPTWHQVQHLRDGWYGIEFKGVVSPGWAKISILIETLDDRGVTGQSRRRVYGTIPITPYHTLNLSGLDFAHLRLGEHFSSCPREAETPGQVTVTYKIEVKGEPKLPFLELSNSLGCLIGVARRRVDITYSPSLLYVQVTVESFLRLYEVNLFVLDETKMGEWLSRAGLTFVEMRRKWQEFSRDSPDLPSECPHGKYYYKGQYVTLPPHAVPINCYSFTCERGYHLIDQWCARNDAEEQVYWNVLALLCLLIFFSGLLALIIRHIVINLLTKTPPTQPKEEDPFLLPVDVTEHGDLVFAAEVVEQRSCHSCYGKFEGCPCSIERPEHACCCRMERGEDCHCCCCFMLNPEADSSEEEPPQYGNSFGSG